MSDDPFKEASKYNTAVRNVGKWFARRVRELEADRENKLRAIRAALSPAAARIVVAAEGAAAPVATVALTAAQMQEALAERQHHGPLKDCIGETREPKPPPEDPNPAPAWLNQEPAPLPAGALLEVPEKPARRRA